MVVVQLGKFAKKSLKIVQIWVSFIICKVCLNKVIKKEKEPQEYEIGFVISLLAL